MLNKEFLKQLDEEEKRLKEALSGVIALRKLYGGDDSHHEAQLGIFTTDDKENLQSNDGYDKYWRAEEKVHYALKQIGRGVADQVAEVLLKLDNDFDEDRAYKTATHKLSQLYRDGVIGADTSGKKYRYFILPDHG